MAQRDGASMQATPAQRRRAVLQTARGAILATHAAAGAAWNVDKDAARLIRGAEGLLRSAVGVLELAGREVPGPRQSRAGVAPGPVPAGDGSGGGGGGGDDAEMGDKKSQKKKKKKQRKTKAMSEGGMDEAKQLPSAGGGGSTLADEWADGLVAHGPFLPQVDPVVAVDPVVDAKLEGPVTRILKAHASRERSPHGRVSSRLPIAGGSYVLRGLESKPMLNGAKVEVLEFHKARDRWSVRLESGVVLCVKPEVLVSEAVL